MSEKKTPKAKDGKVKPSELVRNKVKDARDKPKKMGSLRTASANKWVSLGKKMADPIYFFFRMIVQFEINIIFSAANTGKSMLLMQIAEEIAQQYEILVVDCELSTKQFQLRYTNPDTGSVHLFPENLLRAEINPDLLDDISLEDAIFNSVEQAAKEGIKIIAIDNLTFICTDVEKAEVTIKFMRRLIKLKKEYGLTLIIVAHSPKRDPSKPITRDDLSGSSKLMALIDDAIAVGVSVKGSDIRYVKTIKFRNDEFPYPAESVALYKIHREDNFTKFVYQGRADERDHLKQRNKETDMEDMQEFLNLEAKHMTLKQMEEETGIPKSTIHRKLRIAKKMGMVANAALRPAAPEVPSHPTEEMETMGRVGNEGNELFDKEEA